ncbi:hypothetical protein PV08_05135 [Exophiala spinifera]|uniref:Uncharacterized protein n=1 Tax=Exophiala spinifera TaxID=91928 RepID=A0A0D2BH43_9EURO|nr:uncharacterized protein PV08_05135 [Exophiala spinifera]KIW17940.1 hypothetical protein PV08_05135 [Exophiala spinifera]
MVSCSSIVLSQKQDTWQQVAIRHHCEALRSLTLEMSEGSMSASAVVESSLAVIMMLHMFERFDSSSKPRTCAHLLAAQAIFLEACSTELIKTSLGALLLEAFVYRISINSVFHLELVKGYDSMGALTRLLMSSPTMKRGETAPFRRSLWLGLPPDVYGSLYKVSCLLRMTPLDSKQRNEGIRLSQQLRDLELDEPLDGESDQDDSAGIHQLAARVRHLHLAAAQLILWKILYQDIKASDGRVQQLLHKTMARLSPFQGPAPHVTTVMICPLAILGTAAVQPRDREFLKFQLNSLRSMAGVQELDSVLSFWDDVWSEIAETVAGGDAAPDIEPPQLDVWFDESRLRRVIL